MQEVSGFLNSLVIKTPFSNIPIVGPILFYRYKMKGIISKFLLAGDKFMP